MKDSGSSVYYDIKETVTDIMDNECLHLLIEEHTLINKMFFSLEHNDTLQSNGKRL